MKKKNIFNRYTALIVIMLLLFSSLVFRLSDLQIIDANTYIDEANTKSIRQIPSPAPRGDILDKNYVKLATNKQSYTLVYMETDESKEKFFDTFKEVFSVLDSCSKIDDSGKTVKEQQLDEMQLKVNPYRFEFNVQDVKQKAAQEILFKRNRGLNDLARQNLIKEKIIPDKAEKDLSNADKKKIDEELLKYTPEEVFDYLIVKYELYKLLNLGEAKEKQLLKEKSKGEITDKDIAKMVLEKFSADEVRRYMLIKDAVLLQNYSGFKPVTIASNIDRNTAFIFEQKKNDMPGIDVTMQPIRYYPLHELGSNFIGYISKVQGNSDSYEEKGYDISTDYIGISGLESAFEDRLRGSKGEKIVKVNNQGRQTEELFNLDTTPGQSLVLTIDSKLQKAAEKALNERMEKLRTTENLQEAGMNTGNATRGAAVVLNVKTGGVLAMVSLPNYDPNIFSIPGKLTNSLSKQLFAPDLEAFGKQYIKNMNLNKTVDDLFPVDKNNSTKNYTVRDDKYDIYPKPFYNYATTALVPPGSTFKPLTAVASLQEGVITPSDRVFDAIRFTVPGLSNTWSCYSKGGHGYENVSDALRDSCNYFFYYVGNKLYNKNGLDCLAKYAWKFGLGTDPKTDEKRSTGLEIAEAFGNVYNKDTNISNQAAMSKYYIRDILVSGKYEALNGYSVRFTPINIDTNSEDGDKLSTAKQAIKEKVKSYILKTKRDYAGLKSELLPLFKDLIAALPDGEKAKYNSNDSKNMAEVISTYVTSDVMTQINTPGNVFNASIGQGDNNFTPVQLANYMATLVNGGTRYKVHLVDKFLDSKGNVLEQVKPEAVDKVNINQNVIDAVKVGMEKVTDENGTAANSFRDFPIKTGGKTGSATFRENGVQESVGRTSYGLYVGFAPYNDPEIAVCVVIFDGGHGGYVSDVARAIYETYFRDTLKKDSAFKPKFDYTLNP